MQTNLPGQLKVIAIGTGTCSSVHTGAANRRPPAFLIQYAGRLLLLDCGEGTRLALQTLGIEHHLVTDVFVSHGHPDHACLPAFIQAKYCGKLFTHGPGLGMNHPLNTLNIYLPEALANGIPGSIPSFREMWKWHVPENPDFWDDFRPSIQGLSDDDAWSIGEAIRLNVHKVYHGFGQHPSLAIIANTPEGKIGYTGDCGFTEDLAEFFHGCDLLITDCSSRIGKEYTGGYGHMGPRQCGTLAEQAGVKTLWMTHYTDLDETEAMREEAQRAGFTGNAIVATDNLVWLP